MNLIKMTVTGDIISGSYGKEQFAVKYSKERYEAMRKLEKKMNICDNITEAKLILTLFAMLTKVSYKELIETKCPFIVIDESTGEFFLKNRRFITSIAMPKIIADRIIESAEKDVDFMPIVKMWIRFLRNPKLRKLDKKGKKAFAERFANYINKDYINHERVSKLMDEQGLSEEVAIKYSTVKDVSITQEGLLCTHKVITEVNPSEDEEYRVDEITGFKVGKTINEDRLFIPAVMGYGGDDFYCEGANGYDGRQHYVKVGCVHRLDNWNQVNTNDDIACVPGLHLGGISYVKGYQNAGTETVDCFLDPMHIGAICDGDGAIRCLQYFVHGAWNGSNGSIYHSSTYAELTDAEWESIIDDVMSNLGEEQKKFPKIPTIVEPKNDPTIEIDYDFTESKTLPARDSKGRFIKLKI